ncbi:unnamed protein product [Cladocopium goreaui]|uniref:AAA+ ATPase domain-containing protein n=1 Tax=Cladocopium goreaui TaxID=2562237 RepID=A0A9P1BQK1_9DINO|nr:unnamed protein product [Cladocopium goreaui]
MAGWGGWGCGNEWGGNDWKRKRDSEPKWKNNEHLDYANCGLGSYESEGEWEGKSFYCARCAAKYAVQGHKDDYHEDHSRSAEPWVATYKEKWKDLIEMEWQEELQVVEDRLKNWPLARLVGQGFCITDLEARRQGAFFGKAKIVFSKQNLPRHQFSAGDEVIVSLGNPLDKKAWKGEIIELGMSRIAIVADSPPWELGGRWRLDCGANKTAYERTKSALGYVSGAKYKASEMRRLVLNEEGPLLQELQGDQLADSSEALNEFNELNASQEAAICAVSSFNLGLIQGPPGTGKTTTTCQMIRRMVERRKEEGLRSCGILVAADSNVAVDQLLSGLIRLGVKALRIGFPSKVTAELRQHTLLAQAEEHPLNAKIEETRDALSQVKNALYSGQLKGKGKGLAHRDISLHVRDIQKFEQQVSDELIDAAEVVCSTLIGCGCDALLQSSFDTVIIDEASQATEPRCLVAFQKAKKQFILVGDQKQLPPVVLCQAAAEKGLQDSLFDRLLNSPSLFNREINMLQVQYRMHPLIREWPSLQFYGGKLQDGLPLSSFSKKLMSQPFRTQSFRRPAPIMYLDTSSPDAANFVQHFGGTMCANLESQNNEGSKYNLLEVELVKLVLKTLVEAMFLTLAECGDETGRIVASCVGNVLWVLQPAKTDSGKKPATKLSDFDAMYGCSKYKWCQTGCKDCNPAKTFRWVSHQADEPTLHQGWIWYMVDGTAGAAMPMFRNCLGQSAAEGEIYKVEREVELEVCCICLDSLCAQPVAALLSLESDTTSSCLHYMHAACAERLRPRRCPICRSAFDALSTPISKETLQEMNPSDIVAGLCVLSGHHGRAGTVPPRVAVPLLAALLPLRQTTVQKWVEKELVNSEVLNTKAVEQLLRRAGLGRGNARSEGTSASTTYTAQLRIFRRSRWLALKLMGALHLGCCGMAAGVLLGCFGALPNLRLRFVRHTDDLADLDSWQALLLYVVSVVFMELVVLSLRDPRWVKRGLRYGALLGAVVGWLKALQVVDPDRHSFRRVFQMGLSGQTTWPRQWRLVDSITSVEKVDIFAVNR